MSHPWTPDPASLAAAPLPASFDALVERLARRAHDVWGAARLAEGWRWGPQRDDARREHPCLVPFDALPAEEQEYDRRVVRSTLQAVLQEGWTLQPPGVDRARPESVTTSDWAALVREASFDQLLDLRQRATAESEAGDVAPEQQLLLARRFVSLGHLLLAEQVAQLGLAHAPARSSLHLRLLHVYALSAVRFGAPSLAAERLRDLDAQQLRDLAAGAEHALFVELRSLQGRIHKELALQAGASDTRTARLESALACYADAADVAERDGRDGADGFPQINAAAVASWLGREVVAGEFLQRATARARAARERAPTDPWPVATLAEAALIGGDLASAATQYRRAAQLAGDRAGDIASMRRQARVHARLLDHVTRESVDAWLAVPPVLVFTGHLPDAPDRRTPRLPMTSLPAVQASLHAFIAQHGVAHGFASAAAGGDLLFLELLEARGVPGQVVLPFRREQFVRTSVLGVPGDWGTRFDRQVALAERRHLLYEISGTPASADEVAFEFGNRVLLGLARLKARELETDVVGVALWDGEPGGAGGTAHTVAMWQSLAAAWSADRTGLPSLRIETIEPPPVPRRTDVRGPVTAASPPVSAPPRVSVPHRIAGVLFADVVGFSRVDEESVPRFFDLFLGEVGRRLALHPVAPLVRNTWGDGLFLVFPRVEDAGTFALVLRSALQAVDWSAEGLPADLAVRVGVHAGPLFEFVDRVTGQLTLSGRHVTQAARIEPVTPPGVVYASAEFAALAAAFGVTAFRCESVGQVPLAKGFATTGLYVLQPPFATEDR
jgi:hypothetical protein